MSRVGSWSKSVLTQIEVQAKLLNYTKNRTPGHVLQQCYTAGAVRVTIFSADTKFCLLSNFTELHTLTVVVRSLCTFVMCAYFYSSLLFLYYIVFLSFSNRLHLVSWEMLH